MTIETETYRVRIGLFGPGRGFKKPSSKKVYNPTTTDTDIHFRALLMGILAIGIFGGGVFISNTILDMTTFLSTEDNLQQNICIIPSIKSSDFNTCIHDATSIYNSYLSRIIALSDDVEVNPGPMSDKDEILQAIKANSDQLKTEVKGVRTDIYQVKAEVEKVESLCNEMKSKIDEIEGRQSELEETIENLKGSVRGLRGDRDMLQLDVDSINEKCDENFEKIENAESAVDKIERQLNQKTLRIFGLEEPLGETESKLKTNVINNVCLIACPRETWDTGSIEEAYRVGKPDSENKRIVIAKFTSVSDKHKLFSGRDNLRENNIRISEELTTRERAILSRMKAQGKTGYFSKGKLYIRPENKTTVQEFSSMLKEGSHKKARTILAFVPRMGAVQMMSMKILTLISGRGPKLEQLKILFWNIEGISRKIEFDDLLSYLERFDIIGLAETWEESNVNTKHLLDTHTCFFLPAVKHSKHGRAMGGMSVYCRNDIMKYVERVEDTCCIGIILKLDKLFVNLDENVYIMFVYLPPIDPSSFAL